MKRNQQIKYLVLAVILACVMSTTSISAGVQDNTSISAMLSAIKSAILGVQTDVTSIKSDVAGVTNTLGNVDSISTNKTGTVINRLNHIQQFVDKGNSTTVYYAGTETCAASEEALSALAGIGFVDTGTTRTLLDGSQLKVYMYSNSLGDMNWEVADKTAREFYKEVNDWSIAQGYGAIAVSSRLPSSLERGWIKNYTNDNYKNGYSWISTQCNTSYCMHWSFNASGYMSESNYASDNNSYQCFAAVYIRVP